MSRAKRAVIWIAVSVVVILAIPLLWAGWQYFQFRELRTYSVDIGSISAYTSDYAFDVGEPVPLFVNGPDEVVGDLYRLGANRVEVRADIAIAATEQSDTLHLSDGMEWVETDQLSTDELEPGFYTLELSREPGSDPEFLVAFAIRSEDPDVALILSTNTWDAYNDFGGVSRYQNEHLGFIVRRVIAEAEWWGGRLQDAELPYGRPNLAVSNDLMGQVDPGADYSSRLARHEWTFISFLESNGYNYGLYTDRDFAETGKTWTEVPLLVFAGHAEYWTDQMHFQFERYLADGGKVLMSAGNPMRKPVAYGDTSLVFVREVNPPETINAVIGTSFTAAGVNTSAAFQVLDHEHWVFEGTGLSDGGIFGLESATRPTSEFASDPGADSDGASGFFTLEPGKGSGAFDVLAVGLNMEGPASMVYRDMPAGGWLFNSSSGTFTGSALRDDTVAIVTHNLLRDAIEASTSAARP